MESAQPSPLGVLLVQTRKRAELTQEGLAERAGVSVNTISNLEAGRGHLPRPATLDLLVRALATTLALTPAEQADLRAAFKAAARASRAQRLPATAGGLATTEEAPAASVLPTGPLCFLVCVPVPAGTLQSEHAQALQILLAWPVRPPHVQSWSGRLVDPPDGPDGAVYVFPQASDALMAAIALRKALQEQPGIAVCLALHTAWAEPGAGDYAGPGRRRAVRVARLGHGGQVLLTQPTRDLVQSSLPAGVRLLGAGQQRLSVVERPQPLYQLLQSSQSAAFPPLRSLPTASTNLPVQLTSFIGREREQASVSALLEHASLVTLVGAGGCGKSRLALAVAAELLETYADGVWLVELAALADPALVAQAMATALELHEEAGRSLLATLGEHLQDRRLLVVLDNCEHLLPACAELAATLLRRCPRLQLLATSREQLGIGGETVYRVPSLLLPSPNQHATAAALMEYEGVRLFVERARARRLDFVLTEDNAGVVAEVCRRLDGIPLALELAAAWVGSLPLQVIAARLAESLDVLTEGSRDALPRQQTLRATLDWSWTLLGEPERVLLRRLAVFAGGWTAEAAEAVCGGGELAGWPVLGLLGGLVSKSLVDLHESAGTGRYGLLEMVLQYAAERLVAHEHEAVQLRDAHLHYYAALFATARQELTGPQQAAWMDRLDDELNNIRAALALAGQSSQPAVGLRLAIPLNKYWDRKNYQREGRAWLESLLALPSAADVPERADAVQAVGSLAYRQGHHESAACWLAHSVSLYRGLGDEDGALGAASTLANVYLTQGQIDRAIALYEETLTAFRARNWRWDVASSLNNLGEALAAQGAFARAAACLEESLQGYREIGDLWSVASVLNNLGRLALQRGDLDRAEALSRESLAMNRQLGDQHSTASVHLNLGTVAARRGDAGTARAHYLESLAIHRQRGYRGGIGACLEGLAGLATARQPDLAVRLFGAAAALRAADGEPLPPAERAAYEAGVAQARAALTAAAFQAAWEAGQALSLEQVVVLALEDDTAAPR